MNSLLAPAIALMNRLSYGMKFCLISVLFFVPLGIVSTMLVQQSYERVEVTRHALDSLEVVQGVSKAMRSAELVRDRLAEIREAGVTVAGSLTPQRTQELYDVHMYIVLCTSYI